MTPRACSPHRTLPSGRTPRLLTTIRLPWLIFFLTLVASPPAPATTWNVPLDAPTIAAGMDSAAAGDTVVVGGLERLSEGAPVMAIPVERGSSEGS